MGGTAAEAKNSLGFAYERRGDLPRAYDLYLEATTLDPKSTHAPLQPSSHAAQVLGREVHRAAAVPRARRKVVVPMTPGAPSDALTPPATTAPAAPSTTATAHASAAATATPEAPGPMLPAPSPLQKDVRP